MTIRSPFRLFSRWYVLAACLLVGWASARGTNDSETIGFNPNHHYLQGLMGETLDILNGGLTLEIPIGPEYRTSTTFSYRVVLRYNSRIWDYTPGQYEDFAEGELVGAQQFGLGYTMHFGRIFYGGGIEDDESDNIWHFETGDGAVHPLQEYTLTSEPELQDYYVTTDSTYIRAKPVDDFAAWEVWFPDGTKLELNNNNQTVPMVGSPIEVPDFSNYRDNDWRGVRTTRILGPQSDGTHSYVDVIYDSTEPWYIEQLQDDLGRSIYFDNPGGGPTTAIRIPGMVNEPEVLYTFNYLLDQTVDDPATYTDETGDDQVVDLLDEVVFPLGYSMKFGYLSSGEMSWRELPGGAKYHYDHDWLIFRSTHMTQKGPTALHDTALNPAFTCSWNETYTRQITKKRIELAEDPGIFHTWDYDRDTGPCTPTIAACAVCTSPSNPKLVEITDPFGNLTHYHYYHSEIAVDPDSPLNDFVYAYRWGMPYLVEYFLGPDPEFTNLVRKEEMSYDRDVYGNSLFESWDMNAKFNVRQYSSTTTYYEDGDGLFNVNPVVTQTSTDFDSYGHYQRTSTGGGGAGKVTYTHYTPDLANWRLGQFDYVEVRDASEVPVTRSELEFDSSGQLVATVAHRDPVGAAAAWVQGDPLTASPGDIMTTNLYDSRGNLSSTTTTGCATDQTPCPAGYDYSRTVDYTYDTLNPAHLEERQIQGVSWKPLDREVDPNTGVVTTSRTLAGIETTYEYDPLGRLTRIIPTTPEESTQIAYPSITATTVTRGDQAAEQSMWSHFSYDSLGRLSETQKRHFDGSTSGQTRTYDILGRTTFESEWVVAGILAPPGTTYDYTLTDPAGVTRTDPFGRARTITTADGKTTRFEYLGLEKLVHVDGINDDPLQISTTRFVNDALGRLVFVDSPLPGEDATYEYDRLGNLMSVSMGTQNRWFGYDTFGQLSYATNPENATVFFDAYNAGGSLLKKRDAAGNEFSYEYDVVGRPTNVKVLLAGTTADVTLIENEYDSDPDIGDSITYGDSSGRLVRRKSYADSGEWLATEDRVYDGLNGRLSSKLDDFGFGNLETKYTFNDLGLIETMTYPDASGAANRRIVKNSYKYGFLDHVDDVDDTGLQQFVYLETATYNSAGGVFDLQYGNGLITTIYQDVRNRPFEVQVYDPVLTGGASPGITGIGDDDGVINPRMWPISGTGGQGTGGGILWSSGSYVYDGAGNIIQIGADEFTYDDLGRLATANMFHNTSEYLRSYVYDGYGNMTSLSPGSGSVRQFGVDASRNQLQSQSVGMASHAYQFDVNGNMISDTKGPPTVENEYTYDSRNRMIAATEEHDEEALHVSMSYRYNAEGHRVAKTDELTGVTTYYVRGLDGRTVSEFRRASTVSGLPGWDRDYVYANGQHLALLVNQGPGPVTGLTACGTPCGSTNGSPKVLLQWTPNPESDIAGYYIWRQYRMDNPPPAPEPLNGGLAWTGDPAVGFEDTDHSGPTKNHYYDFWIIPVDQAGREGPSSILAYSRAVDSNEPLKPVWEDPAIIEHETYLDLHWKVNASSDVVAHRLYRGSTATLTESDFFAGPIYPTTADSATYTDTTVDEGQTYHYALKAIDATGNVSIDFSATRSGTPHDSTPPAIPQGLTAEKTDAAKELRISWQGNTEVDLVGYNLYQKGPGESIFTARPENPLTAATLDITGLQEGTYEFEIEAYDDAGKTSVRSSVVSQRPRIDSVTAPVVIGEWDTILTFNGTDNYKLSWTWQPEDVGVYFYSSTSASGPWTRSVNRKDQGIVDWNYPSLECGENYYAMSRVVETSPGIEDETLFTVVSVPPDTSPVADPTTQDLGVSWEKDWQGMDLPGVYYGDCTYAYDGQQYWYTFWFLTNWADNNECDVASYEIEHLPTWTPIWLPVAGAPGDAVDVVLNSGYWHSQTINNMNSNYKGQYRVRVRYANGDVSPWIEDEEYSPLSSCTLETASLEQEVSPGPRRPMLEAEAEWRMASVLSHDAAIDWPLSRVASTSGNGAWLRSQQLASKAIENATGEDSMFTAVDSAAHLAPDGLSKLLTRPVITVGQSPPEWELFYYHMDHLGTPRLITDVNGNTDTYHKYFPFGEEIQALSSENTHEFTGHERDVETGLDYMLGRFCASEQARFLSPDLVPGIPDLPQSLNRYTYSKNSPLTYLDPDGRFVEFFLGVEQRLRQNHGLETAQGRLPSSVVSNITPGAYVWSPGSVGRRAARGSASVLNNYDGNIALVGFSRGAVSAHLSSLTLKAQNKSVQLEVLIDPQLRSNFTIPDNVKLAVNVSTGNNVITAADPSKTNVLNFTFDSATSHGDADDNTADFVAEIVALQQQQGAITPQDVRAAAKRHGLTETQSQPWTSGSLDVNKAGPSAGVSIPGELTVIKDGVRISP